MIHLIKHYLSIEFIQYCNNEHEIWYDVVQGFVLDKIYRTGYSTLNCFFFALNFYPSYLDNE